MTRIIAKLNNKIQKYQQKKAITLSELNVFVLPYRDLLIHPSCRKCSAILAVVILLGYHVLLRAFYSALQALLTSRQQIYILSNGYTYGKQG